MVNLFNGRLEKGRKELVYCLPMVYIMYFISFEKQNTIDGVIALIPAENICSHHFVGYDKFNVIHDRWCIVLRLDLSK